MAAKLDTPWLKNRFSVVSRRLCCYNYDSYRTSVEKSACLRYNKISAKYGGAKSMIDKRYYEKLGGFSYLLGELRKNIGDEQTDVLVSDAVKLCNGLCDKYKGLSEKEKIHTERMIFPRAAIYLQMIKYIPREEALNLIEKAVTAGVEPDRKRLHIATKIPFIRPLFFKIFHKMIGTAFNGEAGFEFREIEYDSKHYRVDVLQCPYAKYCGLLGCKELTETFCLSDDRVYGNMCGIAFERKGTIGRGSDKCDFYFYRSR